jgi:hypothetical protein
MSFSIPTTVHPRSAKWMTHSDPTRPLEPVMIAVRKVGEGTSQLDDYALIRAVVAFLR